MKKEKQLSLSRTRYAAKMLESYSGEDIFADPYAIPFAG